MSDIEFTKAFPGAAKMPTMEQINQVMIHNLNLEKQLAKATELNARYKKALETIEASQPVTLEDGRQWKMTEKDCSRIAHTALFPPTDSSPA